MCSVRGTVVRRTLSPTEFVRSIGTNTHSMDKFCRWWYLWITLGKKPACKNSRWRRLHDPCAASLNSLSDIQTQTYGYSSKSTLEATFLHYITLHCSDNYFEKLQLLYTVSRSYRHGSTILIHRKLQLSLRNKFGRLTKSGCVLSWKRGWDFTYGNHIVIGLLPCP